MGTTTHFRGEKLQVVPGCLCALHWQHERVHSHSNPASSRNQCRRTSLASCRAGGFRTTSSQTVRIGGYSCRLQPSCCHCFADAGPPLGRTAAQAPTGTVRCTLVAFMSPQVLSSKADEQEKPDFRGDHDANNDVVRSSPTQSLQPQHIYFTARAPHHADGSP